MTGIINYGAGNLGSVMNALLRLGEKAAFVRDASELNPAHTPYEKLMFPGDGHFASTIKSLRAAGYDTAIRDWIQADKPFLGICIGLQILFENSEESDDPSLTGLAVLPGSIKLFPAKKIPQIGWNRTFIKRPSRLFTGLEDGAFFYYIHSYYAAPEQDRDITATADYYLEYCSAVERGALSAVQFHPEKSGEAGLKLLQNWLA